jgi:hypothetical protein
MPSERDYAELLLGINEKLERIATALEAFNATAIRTYTIDGQKETGVVIFNRKITPTS